jgi:DNA (cytosine-5)-methyltransferase 1
LGGTTVIGDLAKIGYDAEWRVVSAAGLGAPHRRDRLIIVAYPAELFSNGSNDNAGSGVEPQTISELRNSSGSKGMANTNNTRSRTPNSELEREGSAGKQERQRNITRNGISRRSTDMANTDGRRQQERNENKWRIPIFDQESNGKSLANTDSEQLGQHGFTQNARQTNSVGEHNGTRQTAYDGWQWWEVEPDVGRVANGVPSRVDRLRGLGNAVVPQVAEYVGRLIVNAQ